MTLFGYVLVRKSELNEFKNSYLASQKASQCRRWFSGWKDLDIIWEYMFGCDYLDSVENCRKRYAEARGTDVYGKLR